MDANADALSLALFALTLTGGITFMALRSIRASGREALEKQALAKQPIAE